MCHMVKSIVLSMIILMSARCANMHTVGRTTQIPETGGVAIHLDAQQRLVVASAEAYCAEPSPDALSSYAASLGLGVSTPSNEAVSVTQALQSSTGSIGLRTQSITLMRDALYRMCEASRNNKLENWEVAAFLRRSQDLTAVVLAIEQLTGPLIANQILLKSDARAAANATLLSNQDALNQAEENVREAQTRVTRAEQSDTGETEELEFSKERLREAQEVRDIIKDSRDSSLAMVESEAGGSAEFLPAIQSNRLNEEAIETVATAVRDMVEIALMKNYAVESCLMFLAWKAQQANVTRATAVHNFAKCGDLLDLNELLTQPAIVSATAQYAFP